MNNTAYMIIVAALALAGCTGSQPTSVAPAEVGDAVQPDTLTLYVPGMNEQLQIL